MRWHSCLWQLLLLFDYVRSRWISSRELAMFIHPSILLSKSFYVGFYMQNFQFNFFVTCHGYQYMWSLPSYTTVLTLTESRKVSRKQTLHNHHHHHHHPPPPLHHPSPRFPPPLFFPYSFHSLLVVMSGFRFFFFFFFFFLRSPTISLGFTTFGWDFCVCDRFLIQPLR